MVSALDDAKNIMEALVEGRCQAYLTKPINRARLEEHLRQLTVDRKCLVTMSLGSLSEYLSLI